MKPIVIETGGDVTQTLNGLLRPIAATLRDQLDDISDTDWWAISAALCEAAEVGLRVGISEVAGGLAPHGIDIHSHIHEAV